ncbi:membrane protein [Bacteroidia bacterium]|nr:membrane protein [Bacteroidia bacterium]
MSLFEIILTAIVLGFDCMIVATVCGAQPYISRKNAVVMSLSFGIFQGGMLLLGVLLGILFSGIMQQIDHWFAFGLLFVIGLKMILDALKSHKKNVKQEFRVNRPLVLLALSLATSIDAFVVGISVGLMNNIKFIAPIIVAVFSFVMPLLGFYLGRKAKFVSEKFAQLLGGLVLIGLGIKILAEHLWFS